MHAGKGRVVRDENDNIKRIVEQPDIDLIDSPEERLRLDAQTEGNCPLYAIRAATLKHYLGERHTRQRPGPVLLHRHC